MILESFPTSPGAPAKAILFCSLFPFLHFCRCSLINGRHIFLAIPSFFGALNYFVSLLFIYLGVVVPDLFYFRPPLFIFLLSCWAQPRKLFCGYEKLPRVCLPTVQFFVTCSEERAVYPEKSLHFSPCSQKYVK